MTDPSKGRPEAASPIFAEGWNSVKDALGRLHFGSISITVHDGRIVQVDVTEKHRFPTRA